MKKDLMVDAVGKLDNDLLEKHFKEKEKLKSKKSKPKKAVWLKWSAAVAACLVLVMAIPMALNFFNVLDNGHDGGDKGYITNGVLSVEDLNRPYKDISISSSEVGYVWEWDDKPIYEQYTDLEIDGVEFVGRRREIDASNVGEKIGKKTLSGVADHPNDFPQGLRYKMFEVYEIKNVSPSRMVAVLMEGNYYVFKSDKYDPPATFGALLDEYGLSSVIELSRFTKKDMDKDEAYFTLTDDAYVWEVLSDCRDAQVVDADNWNRYDRNYISFTVTSNALGVYKNAMYVTEDGYLWTNAFSWAYLYYIGEDASNKIISYAMSNSTEANAEPYTNAIVGTVVEITDEYMLVNDAILCENPEDGISFKVMLNDIKISRYIDTGIVKLNSTVRVAYEGKIDIENNYTIYDAVSASEAIIGGDGDVLIPE